LAPEFAPQKSSKKSDYGMSAEKNIKSIGFVVFEWLKRRFWTIVRWGKIHPVAAAFTGIIFLIWLFCLPDPLFQTQYSYVLEDRNGTLLGARIAGDGQWRFPVQDSLPEKYVQCLVTFEDRMFWYHPGFNPASFVQAARQNISRGRTVRGGSTITMQVIRMSRGNPPRTIWQKILEVLMATRLELTFRKKTILQLYAAHAPFGGNVVGLEAASWRYFGKKSSALTWAESATLAVLPNSPALVHPGRGRELLTAKRNRLLTALYERGIIDQETKDLACTEPLPDNPVALPQEAPQLLDHFIKNTPAKAEKAIWRSTVKREFQVRITDVLSRRQELYSGNEVHNLAAIVIDVPTGEVLAYVGNVQGAGAEHGDQVDIIDAPRSTGSILKPYLYAMSMESGTILPGSLLHDVPVQFGNYRPENYKETYDGAVTAKTALVRSLNVPFVQLLRDHGLEKFHYELQQLGLTTINQPPDHYGLSLILGGAEASLLDVTNTYACMARRLGAFYERNGKVAVDDFRRPSFVPVASRSTGRSLSKEADRLSAGAIWHTFQAMQEVERPNSVGDWEMFRSSRRIAWKTGTSFGFRDAWAVGVNARYAVGVWVGNADGEGRPGLIGVEMAAPVLFEIFNQLPGGDEWFDPPYDDMEPLAVCRQSGYRAGEWCTSDTLWAPHNGIKAPVCTYHQLIHLDSTGMWQVNSDCAAPSDMIHKGWFILDPLEEHYYRSKHPEYQPPPPFRSDCTTALAEEQKTPIRLIYPQRAAQIYIPVELDGKLSSVVFQAAHRDANAKIHWHLDDQFLGTTQTFHHFSLQPSIGKHTITLVDEAGNRLQRDFEILRK
jgi:penicillin-binding protein 1C